jgi:urease accessory protein
MSVVTLLHLCDSLFPIGAFGYSDGLEAAVSAGCVRGTDGLRSWLDACLDETIGRTDGPAVLRAWSAFGRRDGPELVRLDREVTALRPSSSARRSGRAMGLRLATTWHALHPEHNMGWLPALATRARAGLALPVAFGCVAAAADVDRRSAAEAFAYTRLAATVSAAMRAMAIGQTQAHAELARVLARVPAVVDGIEEAIVESFAPAMDLASMAQQYLRSRLFRS